tara:strand:- start:9049 stop:10239 length:1191 start_codon:yes stop_codon:yes gene_type:complete
MNIQNLTFNYSAASNGTRRETLHGRDYIVAPMAMLTEGVHNGSGGALYYPEPECRAAVQSWNMRPVVVYHPEINGQGVSACDPDILEKQQVGMVMNTVWDGKLRAEAWLEESRLGEVDGRIMDALEQNTMMEVSTGLFTDNEPETGTYRDKPYTHIARNHRPDHLAILPDRVGACSIADGAGLLQLNEDGGLPDDLSVEKATELVARLQTHIQNHSPPNHEEQTVPNTKLIDALIANDATQWAEGDREVLLNMDDDTLAKTAPVAVEPAPVVEDLEEPEAVEPTGEIVTMEQYVAQAPAEFQDVIRNGLAAHESSKGQLIETITANEANQFSKEFLQTKGLQELEGLAAIAARPAAAAPVAAAPVPMFNGAATPAKPTNNTNSDEGVLVAPTLSWD